MSLEDDHRKLLTIGPMASHIGVQPRDLRAEADAMTIPCVRVGKRGLLFDPEQVMRVLQQRAKASQPGGTGSTEEDDAS